MWGDTGQIKAALGEWNPEAEILAVRPAKGTALLMKPELSRPGSTRARTPWGQLRLAWPQGSAFLRALLGLSGCDHAFTLEKTETKRLNWAGSRI